MKTANSAMKESIYLCLAESLDENGAKYIELLNSLKQKISIDSVHEIRVTVRKLESCLELLNALGIRNKTLVKDLQHVRKIHGPLRNLHVELELISNIEDQNKLKKFKLFLNCHKKKAEKKLRLKLAEIPTGKHDEEIQRGIDKLSKKNTTAMNEKAAKTMKEQYQKASKEFEMTKKLFSLHSPKSIHVIRISTKKLRYQGEILKPSMHFDNFNFKKLKSLQDSFGKIQNNIVLQESIEKYFRKNNKKGSKAIFLLQTNIIKEQLVLMNRVGKMLGIKYKV